MRILSWDIGIKNLAYCIVNNGDIEEWDLIILCENECKKNKINNLVNVLLVKLDVKEWANIDVILIENQPCMKNPTMKTIQNVIFTFFHYIKIKNKYQFDIQLVSAMNKLKIKCDYVFPESLNSIKNTYNLKKKKAILLCEYILKQQNKHLLDYYNKHKKKDDLADAILYCIWYLQLQN